MQAYNSTFADICLQNGSNFHTVTLALKGKHM